MQLIHLLTPAMLLATALCSPLAASDALEARQTDRGSYTVSGLGSAKQSVLNAGGNTLDLAIAMLETERMNTNYAYGMYENEEANSVAVNRQRWDLTLMTCPQAITKATMPPTSACSSRTGACFVSALSVPALWARAKANGTMAQGSSKRTSDTPVPTSREPLTNCSRQFGRLRRRGCPLGLPELLRIRQVVCRTPQWSHWPQQPRHGGHQEVQVCYTVDPGPDRF